MSGAAADRAGDRTAALLAALRDLPPGTQLTILVQAEDLVHALQTRSPGTRLLTTKEAAKTKGFTADTWRRQCEAGHVDGAFQKRRGAPWYMPEASCDARVAALRRGGGAAAAEAGDDAPAPSAATSTNRSRARGPRTSHAAARTDRAQRFLPLTNARGPRAARSA